VKIQCEDSAGVIVNYKKYSVLIAVFVEMTEACAFV
jgi:hypothetical protein